MSIVVAKRRPALLVGLVVAAIGVSAAVVAVTWPTPRPATAEQYFGASSDPNATFVITGNDPTGLFPGGVTRLELTINNTTGRDIDVRTLDVVAGDASPTCDASNLVAPSYSGHEFVGRGKSGVVAVDVGLSIDAHDSCRDVVFPLEFRGSATAWPGSEIVITLGDDTDIGVCHDRFNANKSPDPTGVEGKRVRLDDTCAKNEVSRVIVRSGGPSAGSAQLLGVCVANNNGRVTAIQPTSSCKLAKATYHDLVAAPLTVCVNVNNGHMRAEDTTHCDTGL